MSAAENSEVSARRAKDPKDKIAHNEDGGKEPEGAVLEESESAVKSRDTEPDTEEVVATEDAGKTATTNTSSETSDINGQTEDGASEEDNHNKNSEGGEAENSESKDATDASTTDRAEDAGTQETTPEVREETANDEVEGEEEENSEEVSIPLLEVQDLSPKQRTELYEIGRQFDQDGRKKLALKCYLKCLKGLEQANGFVSLPQCLRQVADIYYKKEEFEKAIQFIQAEKMFYETALVDTSTFQRKLERKQLASEGEEGENGSEDQVTDNPEVQRATEYENLAQLCLDKEQPQLALEYQAKATKLRQQIYGADHPLTAKSLDFFTVIYGEVGKQQYSESMQKLNDPIPNIEDVETVDSINTGVRQRKSKAKDTGMSAEGSTGQEEELEERTVDPEIREQEEWISKMLLWILFILCILCLSGIMFYLYCKLNTSSPSCRAWKSDLHYYYMRFKYYFYHYTSSSGNTYG